MCTVRPWSDVQRRIYFTGNNEEVPRQLSIPETKSLCPVCVFAPRRVSTSLSSVLRALPGNTPFWSKFRTAASQAKPDVHTSSSPCRRPHSALIFFQICPHRLSPRCVLSCSSKLVAVFPPQISHVIDGFSQRSVIVRSYLVFYTSH